jgi:hypothetical protein
MTRGEGRDERGRQPLPRIDPWRDQLDALLLANEEKPARERLTLIRIFEELRALGYEGSSVAQDIPDSSRLCPVSAGPFVSRGTEGLQTRRWRKADSNRWSHLRQRC